MKESEFIKQNKEKWLEFENNLLKNDGDPSKTTKLFIQITDDLSYARTFYQSRSVRSYLNGSAKLLFNDLNKSRKKGLRGFFKFWRSDLPLAIYQARRPMLISFCVFVACFILGIVTCIQDKDFAAEILSVDYVNMTEENIGKGDAMAVYKSRDELRTFFPILYNNLKVDFITFFSGIFMAIGTLVVMITNGIMVGVFQYFFIERGLFWESFLGIWTHGALEIPTIILSGGAGLTLGKGLLFPGTYSRFQAFKISGMRGLKIIIGVIPVTVIAAFIEGFLTRHTDIPNTLRFVFILLSFASVLFYFVFYPLRIGRSEPENVEDEAAQTLVYKPESVFDPAEIYSTGKVLTETFRHLLGNFSFFGKWIAVIAFTYSVLLAVNPLGLFHEEENYSLGVVNFFDYHEYPLLGILTVLCLTALSQVFIMYIKLKLLRSEINSTEPAISAKAFLSAFVVFLLFAGLVYTELNAAVFLAYLLFPFFVFVICVSAYEDINLYDSLRRSVSLLTQSWSRFIVASLLFSLLSFIVYITAAQALRILMVENALTWIITNDEVLAFKLSLGLNAFESSFCLSLYLLLTAISGSLLYFTLKEIGTASHLIARIRKMKFEK